MSGIWAAVDLAGRARCASDAPSLAAPHRGNVRASAPISGGMMRALTNDWAHTFIAAGVASEGPAAAVVAGAVFGARDSFDSGDAGARRVLRAYLEGGRAGVLSLEGSYACVVWDARPGMFLAYRTFPGERPLFWRRADGIVAFASEIKQLLALPLPTPRADMDGLLDLLAPGLEHPDRTTYTEVSRVVPGTWVEADAHDTRTGRVWVPDVATRKMGFADACREFAEILERAVARRLDEHTGLMLSGGLDSSSVAVPASRLHRDRFGTPLRAVTAVYPEAPSVDESAYARATASRLGIELVEVRPGIPHLDEDLRSHELHDGPEIAPMAANGRAIFRLARESGLRNLIDGTDGDSVLGQWNGLASRLLREGRIGLLWRWAKVVAQYRERRPSRVFVAALAPVLAGRAGRAVYRRARGGRETSNVAPWISGALAERFARYRIDGRQGWERAELRAAEWLGVPLEYYERASLAQGAQVLHPLADPDLVSFLIGLPAGVKAGVALPKSLVHGAYARDLPPAVLGRARKMVFDDLFLRAVRERNLAAMLHEVSGVLPWVAWDDVLVSPPDATVDWIRLMLLMSSDSFVAATEHAGTRR